MQANLVVSVKNTYVSIYEYTCHSETPLIFL